MHGAQLSRKEWQERLDKVEEELNLSSPLLARLDLDEEDANTTVDNELLDEATQVESPQKPERNDRRGEDCRH